MEHPENNEAYKGLTVNQGVEQPSIVNPYLNLRKKPKRRQYIRVTPSVSVSAECPVPEKVRRLMYSDCMYSKKKEESWPC